MPLEITSTDSYREDLVSSGVVIKTTDAEVVVNEIKRRTARTIELRSIDPGHSERTLPVREVSWIARVVWASQ